MQQLSGLDASFIYLESAGAPMHIGGVYLFKTLPETDFDYNRFRDHLASRLHMSSIFRQRLVPVPLHLGHPFWVEDPDFDLELHLPHVALPHPGGQAELMRLAAQVFSRPLDRGRPLWEITLVGGLAPSLDPCPERTGSLFAMITKVHHAAIDGGSGAEILGAILDPQPHSQRPLAADEWRPEPMPTAAELIAKTYGKAIKKPLAMARFIGETLSGAIQVIGRENYRDLEPPPSLFSAPKTCLNQCVSSRRTFAGTVLPLERFKRIKNRLPGTTLNDVVLAVCAGGLRTYLQPAGLLPEKPLVAMVPVSVRAEKQRGAMGNQVSAMLVSLATDQADPLKRLLAIRQSAMGSKVYSRALSSNKIMEFVPSETAALAARLYTRMRVARKHRPFFNLVITNVPGPRQPLFMAGSQLLHNLGTAPIFDGMGLILVITSYADTLSLSVTSCREIIPDPQRLVHGLEQALGQLEAALDRPIEENFRLDSNPEPSAGASSWQRLIHHLDQAIVHLNDTSSSEADPAPDPPG